MPPISRQHANVAVLTVGTALFQSVTVMVIALSGLVGAELASQPSLATLPIAASVIGTAVLTIPASLLMGRIGRRAGFVIGSLLGVAGGGISAAAIAWDDFALFCLGNVLVGGFRAFAQFYRFAAAEAAAPEFRSRAISYVLAGGVVAAVLGPELAKATREALPGVPFAGAYLAATGLAVLSTLVLGFLRIERPRAAGSADAAARPLRVIARDPLFVAAIAGGAVGYAVMNLVMTATPLAMVHHHGHGVDDAAFVIEWHVLGMFVPSFFTGNLIRRWGAPRIMLGGVALLAGHVAVALSGHALLHYVSGLTLLGVGWNFLYVGGTALLTETYRPSERSKVEALNDFLIFGLVTVSSLASGALQHRWGWEFLNVAVVPFLVATAAMLLWVVRIRPRAAAAPAR